MEKNVTEFIIDDMEQSNTIEELKSYYIDVSNWFVGNVMLGVDKDELGEWCIGVVHDTQSLICNLRPAALAPFLMHLNQLLLALVGCVESMRVHWIEVSRLSHRRRMWYVIPLLVVSWVCFWKRRRLLKRNSGSVVGCPS